jgi:Uri superfamily endonuclease
VALFHTYQLHIRVPQPLRLAIGRLGEFDFPAGRYVYTGSARRNFEARIARHLRREKTPALAHRPSAHGVPGVTVTNVIRSQAGECDLNQATPGVIPVPGFGASDCGRRCGSHLKYLGW